TALVKCAQIEPQIAQFINFSPNIKETNESILTFPLFNPWRTVSSDRIEVNREANETDAFNKRQQVLTDLQLNPAKFPSVTKILQSSMSQTSIEALEKWKAEMIEKLGRDGFAEFQKQTFTRGRLLHQCIAHQLQGEQNIEIDELIKPLWQSLTHIFPSINEVKFIEKTVKHPYLCYKGIVDCVAYYNKELVVIDWKTSARTKPFISNLYDEPLQAVAYLGALNFDLAFSHIQVDKVAIVIAYTNGTPAQVHKLSTESCQNYWKHWLSRLKKHWEIVRDKNEQENEGALN
ncbi:hypothetical protein B4U79_10667, partial [Dinothrombium tinctorium]